MVVLVYRYGFDFDLSETRATTTDRLLHKSAHAHGEMDEEMCGVVGCAVVGFHSGWSRLTNLPCYLLKCSDMDKYGNNTAYTKNKNSSNNITRYRLDKLNLKHWRFWLFPFYLNQFLINVTKRYYHERNF